MKLFLNEDDWRIAYFQYPPSCDGYFSENFTALGFFAVKNEKKTEPNLIWANLTETNIFFYGELSSGEKSAHGILQ